MPTTDDRDADDPAVERRRALGDLLVSMREFSIFVTKTIEIFADGPIPSDAEMVE